MEYVHSCFYSENAPKVHNVPYRTRKIFMSLVIQADECERGCKQAASPDAEECMLRFSFTLLLIAVTHPLFAQFTYAPTCRVPFLPKHGGSTITAKSWASTKTP